MRISQVSLSFMGFNNDYNPSTGTSINDSKWHFIGITFDGSTLKGWVDGQLEWTTAKELNTSGQSNFIGQSNHITAECYFIGKIDDLRFYSRALSESEIQVLYNEGGWDQN